MSKELDDILESDEDLKKIVTGGDVRAGHKIQINFGPGRSGLREFKAIVTIWESGKFFNGDGDGVMYSCLDHRLFEKDNTTPPSALPIFRRMQKERTEWGCGHPIGGADMRGPVALCPGCKNMVKCKDLTGQIPFYGTVAELSELVAIIFHLLNDNADIYCKYDRTDIRYKTVEVKNGAEEARKLRGLLIYPYYRILQDIANGSSLESRFRAFFLA